MSSQVSPAMQSIQRYMLVGMIMFGVVTFGIGGWATTSQLSGAVIAQGVVVVDSSVKKVQHATGGIVGELRVRQGDRVNAGDVLIRLDETQTLANATIVTNSIDELLARQARLEAERDGAEQVVFPKVLLDRARENNSEASRAMTAERKLFDLRRQARSGQKAQLQEKSAQLENEIKGYTGQTEAENTPTRLNIPIAPHVAAQAWRSEFEQKLMAPLDAFAPDLILISAGFDAHRRDPLAHQSLEASDFAHMTRALVEIAKAHAKGRIVSSLEGGYDLQALGQSALAHVDALVQP